MVGKRPPAKRNRKESGRVEQSAVDWYLMNPCVGVPDICPPLCSWHQLTDGTFTLADVEMFNQALNEMIEAYNAATGGQ